MNLLEHQGKELFASTGIPVPSGRVVSTPDAAAAAAEMLGGRVVLKSQIGTGKRGKSGGILFADDPGQAAAGAERLLGSEIAGFRVEQLLVERGVDIDRELYAALLNDPATTGPLLLFAAHGGMDVEEAGEGAVARLPIDIRRGPGRDECRELVAGAADLPGDVVDRIADLMLAMYRLYRTLEADLVEINPLVLTASGEVVALDSKISLDPGAVPRHQELTGELVERAAPAGTELEQRGRELGLQFIELDGDVGVLANGAGLTMTTLDAVHHHGGSPANFLEIGGDAYTKATPALDLVLRNPRVRSLLVNFCGAFARTDVMTAGVVQAIEELAPGIPVFFSVHGTGEAEAVALLADRLGVRPYDRMDDAVRAAVRAAAGEEVPA